MRKEILKTVLKIPPRLNRPALLGHPCMDDPWVLIPKIPSLTSLLVEGASWLMQHVWRFPMHLPTPTIHYSCMVIQDSVRRT